MDSNMELRIVRLEAQLRRWRMLTALALVAVAMLVLAAAGPLGAQQPSDDQFIRQVPAHKLAAHDFTLLGQDGRPHGHLFMKGDDPVLELYGAKGEVIWSAPPKSGFRPVQDNH